MEYRIVFRQTNKVGPGFTGSSVDINVEFDVTARRRAHQLLKRKNKKGPEKYELLRIVKVLQPEINTEIPLYN